MRRQSPTPAVASPGRVQPEPVTHSAPRLPGVPVLAQRWLDVTFVHWAVDPRLVAPLIPEGTRPDVLRGTSYVGMVALRIDRTGPPGLPVPYLGSFAEINVRLYSVGPDGRRGVVFRSMDAARLLPVVAARTGIRLPYTWARMRVDRDGDLVTYTSTRRWPGPRGARVLIRVAAGEPIGEPSELEDFLTARWGLHTTWYGGREWYLRGWHPRWRLHRAQLVDLDEDLIHRAGLPPPRSAPVSVLYSPGVPVRFGLPGPLSRRSEGRHRRPAGHDGPHRGLR